MSEAVDVAKTGGAVDALIWNVREFLKAKAVEWHLTKGRKVFQSANWLAPSMLNISHEFPAADTV